MYKLKIKDPKRLQVIVYINLDSQYFIKLYIDCKDSEENQKYINDFLESVAELNYLPI